MRARTLIFALLVVMAGTPAAQAQQVVDRIVARVEDDILTLSEVRELGRFQQLVNSPGTGAQSRLPREDELIERLIDQWIVNTEATAARFSLPKKEDVQKEVERLAEQFGSADAYRARLRELGLTAESVARNVERQIYLARYLDYKLRPAAHVENAQVEKYFREELAPELRKRGQDAPALESVEGQVRELLTQREISARAAKWLEETRARLRIEIAGKKNTP
jgi:peptidyl-prolyl cis-trans isomerase SurA